MINEASPNPAEAAKWTLVDAGKSTKRERAAVQPLLLPGTLSSVVERSMVGGAEPFSLRGILLFSPLKVPFNQPAWSLLALPSAASQAHDITGTPQCWHATQGLPVVHDGQKIHTRFLSLKGSHRNSAVPPRQSGIQTGSLWIAGHSPAKLPQSVPSPWREILRRRSSRGSSGAHGCVRASRGRAETTPQILAQTLCRAASKPSWPPPPPATSDGQICVRLFWWSLGPLKDHRVQQ